MVIYVCKKPIDSALIWFKITTLHVLKREFKSIEEERPEVFNQVIDGDFIRNQKSFTQDFRKGGDIYCVPATVEELALGNWRQGSGPGHLSSDVKYQWPGQSWKMHQ